MSSSYESTFIPFQERGDLWKDITPVPQFSPNVEILKIQYKPEYIELMDYFRAIILKNELSQRAYDLTTEVINEAPTNYMAWQHRRCCLDSCDISLEDELNWLDSIMVENQKNYQIWQHRRVLIEKMQQTSHEKPLLQEVYDEDSKNFHAWCHRIWVVRRFNLTEGEFEFVDKCLDEDIKNNSVWNYRFFLIGFVYLNKENVENKKEIIDKEIQYGLDKIIKCKENESAYSYVRGYLDKYHYKYADFPQIKKTLLKLKDEGFLVSFILSMLVDIYEEEADKENAFKMIDELVELDYIRKKYWLWRKTQIS